MPEVKVNKQGADRIRAGHLWLYRSHILAATAEPGSIVSILDQQRNFVGHALYSSTSEIALRLLTTRKETIDREWWRERLRGAARRRSHLDGLAEAFRIVYSEGDLLPSLIIDRYRDVLVIQTLSQGMEAFKPLLVELLIEEYSPRAIVERNDVRVRQLEGLEQITGTLYGETPAELEVNQHGISFLVSPLSGQKTGSFLDQRENHLAAAAVASGRALDCFTFTGGFALHLAKSCESVLGLDISAGAVEAAQRNASLNRAANVEFREANVFDALHELEASGEKFDTIILDPPAFAKNRQSVKAAARGYKEINLRALKMLSQGGVLVTCTCSYHISEGMFLEIVTEAAKDAKRKLQVVAKRTQASDHPILLSVPETYYLKCLILRVMD